MQRLFKLAVVASFLVGQPVKADPPATKYIRLNLAILEYGDCYLKIEETSEPMSSATKFQGEAASLNRFTNADILKSKDGVYRIIHSFDHPDPLEKIFAFKGNLALNNAEGTLELKTAKGLRPNTFYWSRYHLPLIVCYDRLPIAKQTGLTTQVGIHHLGRLGVNLSKRADDKTLVWLYWNDYDDNGRYQKGNDGTYLTPMTSTPAEIDLANGYHNKFRLPVPNARIEDVVDLRLFDAGTDIPQSSAVAHCLVQGRPVPVIGLDATMKSSVVFVGQPWLGGIADKAGFKYGDVLVSINGHEPKTAADFDEVLSNVSPGDQLTFKIKRMDQEQEIKIVAE